MPVIATFSTFRISALAVSCVIKLVATSQGSNLFRYGNANSNGTLFILLDIFVFVHSDLNFHQNTT